MRKIEELEPQIKVLSDEELCAKTPYFKEQLANGRTLDDILPEAYAVVREAAMGLCTRGHIMYRCLAVLFFIREEFQK